MIDKEKEIPNDILIEASKMLFEYFYKYGTTQPMTPPEEMGHPLYENLILKGEIDRSFDYGCGREFLIGKKIICHTYNKRTVEITASIVLSARIISPPNKENTDGK
jgi:hypothetical protein